MPTPLLASTNWPGPTNTGVPPRTVLTPSGSVILKRDGQVVTNLDITGTVDVHAKGVVLRRSRITHASPGLAIRMFGSAANLLVEDVEIDGRGQTSTAVGDGEYTLRRVNIHHVIDGAKLGSRAKVLDSWIHDLVRIDGSHNDCLEITGATAILIRHNSLDAYQERTHDPMNACLSINPKTGRSVSNLLFDDNYCNGGDYTISARPDLVASNIVFGGNKFGRDCHYGIISQPRYPGFTWEASNVWLDDGQPVVT
jgi:hypothetical protein